ncbi:MAG: hypothetical protein WKF73_11930 [Nocardioidaceae bacterium]
MGLSRWWLFDEPWIFDDTADLAAAAGLTKGWVSAHRQLAATHGWDHDPVGDLARLVRLPGTINAKIADSPVDAVLMRANGPRYEREELQALIDRSHHGATLPRDGRTPIPEIIPATNVPFTVSADAEPPAEMLAALLNNERARGSWNHDRPDFPGPVAQQLRPQPGEYRRPGRLARPAASWTS